MLAFASKCADMQCSRLGTSFLPVNLNESASTKRYHQTLPLNVSSNGGDASRVGKRCSHYLAELVFSSYLYPDAGRVAPISDSVGCLSLSQNGIIGQHKTLPLMGATRLASGKDAAII